MDDHFVNYKTPKCIQCKETSIVKLPVDGYLRWQNGSSAQTAFPTFTSDQRELIISGIHADCWKEIFKDESE